MGRVYIANRPTVTPTINQVILSLTSAAGQAAQVEEIIVGGEGTASAVNNMVIRRSSTNGVTPTAQTAAKLSPRDPASLITVATTFATQPITAADPGPWRDALNVFGGKIRWVPAPGMGIWIVGATAGENEVSLQSAVGTGVVSCQLLFEEV